ncbi:MAG TPA: hypothetical protein VH679_02540 [Vicinamibacterales bacterium]
MSVLIRLGDRIPRLNAARSTNMVSLVVSMVLVVSVQTPPPASAGSYAGTWIAEFSGTTYIRLELQGTDAAVTGRISLGNIEVDAQGQVAKAQAARAFRPLLDVVRRESHLAFASKDEHDLDRFELRLLAADSAELTLLLSDEDRKEVAAAGIPVPKPFRLKKISS